MKGFKMRSFKPPAQFIADCKGLDFLNSGGCSRQTQLDWMGDGERLMSWLDQAGLVPRATLMQLKRETNRKALDRIASQARSLRRWLREIVDRHRGRPLTRVDIANFELLNRILLQDVRYSRVVAADRQASAPVLQSMRHWSAPNSLLWSIAETVAKLICEEDFRQIRGCEGCSLIFLDRTRQQARKWCSMSTCGNRAKQAAHRSRRRSPRGAAARR
jgi:predicted RNA-binding Zn ribbon-like protein